MRSTTSSIRARARRSSDDHDDAIASSSSSASVTMAAISTIASRAGSRPVISQSIHTSRSFTRRQPTSRPRGRSWQTSRVQYRGEQQAEDRALAYAVEGRALELGTVVVDGRGRPERPGCACPLAMLNRHGLVAGATGTGKTKTLQLMAEQLSAAGVPVLIADVKGDLSGLSQAGSTTARVAGRAADTGDDWQPQALPRRVPLARPAGARRPMRATSPASARSCCRRCWASTTPRSRRSALIFHWADIARLAAARHQGPARGHHSTSRATRARRTSRASAASRRRRRA